MCYDARGFRGETINERHTIKMDIETAAIGLLLAFFLFFRYLFMNRTRILFFCSLFLMGWSFYKVNPDLLASLLVASQIMVIIGLAYLKEMGHPMIPRIQAFFTPKKLQVIQIVFIAVILAALWKFYA